MSAKLSLRLPRIGAAAKLALAVEGEEDVVDEVRGRPRLALETRPSAPRCQASEARLQ